MNCDTYAALLDQWMEGDLPPEDAARLQAHEALCPACAQRRKDAQALLDDLRSLRAEMPELPADFHQRWLRSVEEESKAMEHKAKMPRRGLRRGLAVAAAAVALVGGTLLTRDSLNAVPQAEQMALSAPRLQAEAAYDANGMDGGASYGITLASGGSRSASAESGAQEESKIIRNVSLTLGVQDFDGALAALQAQCQARGGYISYISRDGSQASGREAYLTARIPAGELEGFLQEAAGAGRLLEQTESAQDVTASYQDTAARLATQQAKMERLQALMEQTGSLSELLELENAIADTQYELDRLQAQLNRTDDQVDYATVDMTLREEGAAQAVSAREKPLGERLLAALATGWDSFAGFGTDMLVFLGAALPYLAAPAALVLLWRFVAHIRRKRKER